MSLTSMVPTVSRLWAVEGLGLGLGMGLSVFMVLGLGLVLEFYG